MRMIPLYGGGEAIVDEEDYEVLISTKWRLSSNGYVVCTTHDYVDGVRKTYHPSMHRVVMGAKKGQIVDHINRNKLDNRRENLRFCTQSQNIVNSQVKTNNTSGYTGVRRKRTGWMAEIGYKNKMIFLGSFKNKEDAIKTRKEAEQRLYPI